MHAMNIRDQIQSEVADLLAYFPGRGRLPVLWLIALPAAALMPWLFAARTQLYSPGQTAVPFHVYLIAGRFAFLPLKAIGFVLLLRICHSPRSCWRDSLRIIASSIIYGAIITVPSVGITAIWIMAQCGITLVSAFQAGVGVILVAGTTMLLALGLGALAHHAGLAIPLLLWLAPSYIWLTPALYSQQILNWPEPVLWLFTHAVPMSSALQIMRAGVTSSSTPLPGSHWVFGLLYGIIGFTLVFWQLRKLGLTVTHGDTEQPPA